MGAGVRYEWPVTCTVAGVAGVDRLLHNEEISLIEHFPKERSELTVPYASGQDCPRQANSSKTALLLRQQHRLCVLVCEHFHRGW